MLGTLQLKTISSVWGSGQFFVPRECTLDSKSNVTSVQLLINCGITMFICRQDAVWVFSRVCKTNICVYVHVIVYMYMHITLTGLRKAFLPLNYLEYLSMRQFTTGKRALFANLP